MTKYKIGPKVLRNVCPISLMFWNKEMKKKTPAFIKNDSPPVLPPVTSGFYRYPMKKKEKTMIMQKLSMIEVKLCGLAELLYKLWNPTS